MLDAYIYQAELPLAPSELGNWSGIPLAVLPPPTAEAIAPLPGLIALGNSLWAASIALATSTASCALLLSIVFCAIYAVARHRDPKPHQPARAPSPARRRVEACALLAFAAAVFYALARDHTALLPATVASSGGILIALATVALVNPVPPPPPAVARPHTTTHRPWLTSARELTQQHDRRRARHRAQVKLAAAAAVPAGAFSLYLASARTLSNAHFFCALALFILDIDADAIASAVDTQDAPLQSHIPVYLRRRAEVLLDLLAIANAILAGLLSVNNWLVDMLEGPFGLKPETVQVPMPELETEREPERDARPPEKGAHFSAERAPLDAAVPKKQSAWKMPSARKTAPPMSMLTSTSGSWSGYKTAAPMPMLTSTSGSWSGYKTAPSRSMYTTSTSTSRSFLSYTGKLTWPRSSTPESAKEKEKDTPPTSPDAEEDAGKPKASGNGAQNDGDSRSGEEHDNGGYNGDDDDDDDDGAGGGGAAIGVAAAPAPAVVPPQPQMAAADIPAVAGPSMLAPPAPAQNGNATPPVPTLAPVATPAVPNPVPAAPSTQAEDTNKTVAGPAPTSFGPGVLSGPVPADAITPDIERKLMSACQSASAGKAGHVAPKSRSRGHHGGRPQVPKVSTSSSEQQQASSSREPAKSTGAPAAPFFDLDDPLQPTADAPEKHEGPLHIPGWKKPEPPAIPSPSAPGEQNAPPPWFAAFGPGILGQVDVPQDAIKPEVLRKLESAGQSASAGKAGHGPRTRGSAASPLGAARPQPQASTSAAASSSAGASASTNAKTTEPFFSLDDPLQPYVPPVQTQATASAAPAVPGATSNGPPPPNFFRNSPLWVEPKPKPEEQPAGAVVEGQVEAAAAAGGASQTPPVAAPASDSGPADTTTTAIDDAVEPEAPDARWTWRNSERSGAFSLSVADSDDESDDDEDMPDARRGPESADVVELGQLLARLTLEDKDEPERVLVPVPDAQPAVVPAVAAAPVVADTGVHTIGDASNLPVFELSDGYVSSDKEADSVEETDSDEETSSDDETDDPTPVTASPAAPAAIVHTIGDASNLPAFELSDGYVSSNDDSGEETDGDEETSNDEETHCDPAPALPPVAAAPAAIVRSTGDASSLPAFEFPDGYISSDKEEDGDQASVTAAPAVDEVAPVVHVAAPIRDAASPAPSESSGDDEGTMRMASYILLPRFRARRNEPAPVIAPIAGPATPVEDVPQLPAEVHMEEMVGSEQDEDTPMAIADDNHENYKNSGDDSSSAMVMQIPELRPGDLPPDSDDDDEDMEEVVFPVLQPGDLPSDDEFHSKWDADDEDEGTGVVQLHGDVTSDSEVDSSESDSDDSDSDDDAQRFTVDEKGKQKAEDEDDRMQSPSESESDSDSDSDSDDDDDDDAPRFTAAQKGKQKAADQDAKETETANEVPTPEEWALNERYAAREATTIEQQQKILDDAKRRKPQEVPELDMQQAIHNSYNDAHMKTKRADAKIENDKELGSETAQDDDCAAKGEQTAAAQPDAATQAVCASEGTCFGEQHAIERSLEDRAHAAADEKTEEEEKNKKIEEDAEQARASPTTVERAAHLRAGKKTMPVPSAPTPAPAPTITPAAAQTAPPAAATQTRTQTQTPSPARANPNPKTIIPITAPVYRITRPGPAPRETPAPMFAPTPAPAPPRARARPQTEAAGPDLSTPPPPVTPQPIGTPGAGPSAAGYLMNAYRPYIPTRPSAAAPAHANAGHAGMGNDAKKDADEHMADDAGLKDKAAEDMSKKDAVDEDMKIDADAAETTDKKNAAEDETMDAAEDQNMVAPAPGPPTAEQRRIALENAKKKATAAAAALALSSATPHASSPASAAAAPQVSSSAPPQASSSTTHPTGLAALAEAAAAAPFDMDVEREDSLMEISPVAAQQAFAFGQQQHQFAFGQQYPQQTMFGQQQQPFVQQHQDQAMFGQQQQSFIQQQEQPSFDQQQPSFGHHLQPAVGVAQNAHQDATFFPQPQQTFVDADMQDPVFVVQPQHVPQQDPLFGQSFYHQPQQQHQQMFGMDTQQQQQQQYWPQQQYWQQQQQQQPQYQQFFGGNDLQQQQQQWPAQHDMYTYFGQHLDGVQQHMQQQLSTPNEQLPSPVQQPLYGQQQLFPPLPPAQQEQPLLASVPAPVPEESVQPALNQIGNAPAAPLFGGTSPLNRLPRESFMRSQVAQQAVEAAVNAVEPTPSSSSEQYTKQPSPPPDDVALAVNAALIEYDRRERDKKTNAAEDALAAERAPSPDPGAEGEIQTPEQIAQRKVRGLPASRMRGRAQAPSPEPAPAQVGPEPAPAGVDPEPALAQTSLDDFSMVGVLLAIFNGTLTPTALELAAQPCLRKAILTMAQHPDNAQRMATLPLAVRAVDLASADRAVHPERQMELMADRELMDFVCTLDYARTMGGPEEGEIQTPEQIAQREVRGRPSSRLQGQPEAPSPELLRRFIDSEVSAIFEGRQVPTAEYLAARPYLQNAILDMLEKQDNLQPIATLPLAVRAVHLAHSDLALHREELAADLELLEFVRTLVTAIHAHYTTDGTEAAAQDEDEVQTQEQIDQREKKRLPRRKGS